MKESRERKNGVIFSYVSIVLNTIIQLLYLPFLLSKLGKSEYGVYSLVASIIGYLTILDFGFGDAIVLYTAKYRVQGKVEEERKLHGMFQTIFSIIALISLIIGIIISLNANYIFGNSMSFEEIGKLRILLFILSINLTLTFVFSIYSSILKAYEKFTFRKLIAMLHSILQPIIMIPLLLLGFKSIALCIVITLLNVMVLLSNYFYCKKKIGISLDFKGFDMNLFKAIASYSFYIFLNVVVDKINWSIDQFILGIVSGTTAITIYSFASRINDMFIKLSSAISRCIIS